MAAVMGCYFCGEDRTCERCKPVDTSRPGVVDACNAWGDYNWRELKPGERLDDFKFRRLRHADGSHTYGVAPSAPEAQVIVDAVMQVHREMEEAPENTTHENNPSASPLPPPSPPDAPIPGVGGGNEGITTVCPTCGEKQAQPHMLASTYGPGPHLLYCSQRCSGEVWSER